MKIRSWSLEDGEAYAYSDEVQIRPCTEQDLGLDPDAMEKSKFYKHDPRSLRSLRKLWNKFKCYDE